MDAEIVWMRRDLRLADHPALFEAAGTGRAVVPVFVYGEEERALAEEGEASNWWLHHSLEALASVLAGLGSRLLVYHGDPAVVIPALAQRLGAVAVRVNRRYEPQGVVVDGRVQHALEQQGCRWYEHSGNLLHEPEDVVTKSGEPYRVFTPWWRASVKQSVRQPLPTILGLRSLEKWPEDDGLGALGLLTKLDWADAFSDCWEPGEAGACRRLDHACTSVVLRYAGARDFPDDENGVSHLSPHLHFGEVSPRQAWHKILASVPSGSDAFRRQLGWRDFAHATLAANPRTVNQNLDQRFDRFPWRNAPSELVRWQRGLTGYPYIDAGMRELWHTGWMHNRVRMAVASFLVKHLLIHWRHGADWFADTLVDADIANNVFGWQWSAGCGADAAPYFRIFNPILQGKKFDPKGRYVRKWVPELAEVPDKYLHCPWDMPPLELAAAGVCLGDTYPHPIVNHPEARARALEALKQRG